MWRIGQLRHTRSLTLTLSRQRARELESFKLIRKRSGEKGPIGCVGSVIRGAISRALASAASASRTRLGALTHCAGPQGYEWQESGAHESVNEFLEVLDAAFAGEHQLAVFDCAGAESALYGFAKHDVFSSYKVAQFDVGTNLFVA